MTPLLAAFGVVLNSPALRPAALRPALLTPLAAPRHAAVVALEAPDNPYRVLGVTEDATYDEIMDAHIELTESCGGDEACVARFDSAKEKILDDRLRARMSGSLGAAAGVEQVAAAFDRPPPKRTMPWVYIPRIARKVFAMPTKKWAIQVVGLLGGLRSPRGARRARSARCCCSTRCRARAGCTTAARPTSCATTRGRSARCGR